MVNTVRFSDLDKSSTVTDETVLAVSESTSAGNVSKQITAKQMSDYVQGELLFTNISEPASFVETSPVNIQLGPYVVKAYKQSQSTPSPITPLNAKMMMPIYSNVNTNAGTSYSMPIYAQNFTFSNNITAVAASDSTSSFTSISVTRIDDYTLNLTFTSSVTMTANGYIPTPIHSIVVTDTTNSVKCIVSCSPGKKIVSNSLSNLSIDSSGSISFKLNSYGDGSYGFFVTKPVVKLLNAQGTEIASTSILPNDYFGQCVNVRTGGNLWTSNFLKANLTDSYSGVVTVSVTDSLSGQVATGTISVNYVKG